MLHEELVKGIIILFCITGIYRLR
ncbi:MAG: hypothetical protein JWP78_3776, partial [Mucilaginibacter sp.]|nr:hypothetical protein [Mucilaginibacter sp.]